MVLKAEMASQKIPSRWTCPRTRPGRSCMAAIGPTTCLPHLLQNPWPGCTAAPHPSQNMIVSCARFIVDDYKPLNKLKRKCEPEFRGSEMKSVESKPLDYRSANQPIRF